MRYFTTGVVGGLGAKGEGGNRSTQERCLMHQPQMGRPQQTALVATTADRMRVTKATSVCRNERTVATSTGFIKITSTGFIKITSTGFIEITSTGFIKTTTTGHIKDNKSAQRAASGTTRATSAGRNTSNQRYICLSDGNNSWRWLISDVISKPSRRITRIVLSPATVPNTSGIERLSIDTVIALA